MFKKTTKFEYYKTKRKNQVFFSWEYNNLNISSYSIRCYISRLEILFCFTQVVLLNTLLVANTAYVYVVI